MEGIAIKKHRIIFIMIFLIIFVLTVCISFLCGLFVGEYLEAKKIQENFIEYNVFKTSTFYGTILEVNEAKNIRGNLTIVVEGLEFDSDYKGKYYIEVSETTSIRRSGKKIDISELKIGDKIEIIYNKGVVSTINPKRIRGTIIIEVMKLIGPSSNQESY